MKKQNIMIVLGMILVLAAVSACQPQTGNGTKGTYQPVTFDLGKDINTKNFASADELNSFISSNSGYGYNGRIMYSKGIATAQFDMEESAVASGAAVKMAGDSAVPSVEPSDFSTTNIQVEGVDEADLLKTDGNYIYTISDNTVFIIKAYPGEDAEVVSKIKLDYSPQDLFILGDKLAVFGNFYDNAYFRKIDFTPRSGMAFFNIYDVSDRADPTLEKEYKFEGNYFRARMKGNYVYFVTNTLPEVRPVPMPLIFEGDVRKTVPANNIYYYDINYQNPIFININAINMADLSEEITSKSIVVEGSQEMYMSNDNMFVTYTEWVDEYEIEKQIIMDLIDPKLTEKDRELIARIKATDDDILSRYEKEQKIFQVYESYAGMMTVEEQEDMQDQVDALLKKKLEEYKYFEYTVIHKISIDGKDIEASANGKVPGHIINQFSMDEKDGVLRIATTISQRWSRFDKQSTKSENNIYALDSGLEVIGELDGLAEGEQIFSTRFIGDRLYMVTFKQVDPFFVIDLSDPRDIKDLGKLKIPGFSRYLHPYDENTIIGIGRDASETGRQKGLKISLFDVSDVENPKEIAKYVGEDRYAQSSAEYEHKAFLFSKEKDLLVIPVYSYSYDGKGDNYNGAFVFKITPDDIELRGLIDHSMGAQGQYWQPAVERSLYIEDLLYTKSKNLLRINRIDDLEKVKNVELAGGTTTVKVY